MADTVDALSQTHDYIVIDTPGHDSHLMRLAHVMADTLITPLNDSFVDLDVLGSFDADTFDVTGISHYSETVEQARQQRLVSGQSRPTGSYCETDFRCCRRATIVLSMPGCRSFPDGLVSAALKDWPSG